ncbi:type II toxin-antitoxin system HicB family antitoxin [Psychrobacillus sp. MER TA 171]|uniref:type II toxin-antitoxin system HicB family antitoxin n=1 Tax=Psychrobacillus sp. MER TA 171 TaxID=2939577 RepID=UPI00203F5D63|nr:type II toxin-antitoxin system HicB family antitoxin [Psychrobacillus sp. MER TA 171]MCM3358664.1 type II toxin-antitoxin system HicB family antitoxin [Psychrobacillus sp. MER TA 171]
MTVNNKYSNNSEATHVSVTHKVEEGSQITETKVSEKRATKKATFVLPIELHKRLKTAAAEQDKTMLEIVEEALGNHLKI